MVQNWNIYENIRKQTCVTIRFVDSVGIDPIQYKRVSTRQAERNIERATRHKSINKTNKMTNATESKITTSTAVNDVIQENSLPITDNTSENSHNNKKRKFNTSSPEIGRGSIQNSSLECIDTSLPVVEISDDLHVSPVPLPPSPPSLDAVHPNVATLSESTTEAICTNETSVDDTIFEKDSVCLSSSVILCSCCDAPMDPSHTCDTTETDSQLLPESEPPDPEPDDSNVSNLVESTKDPKPCDEETMLCFPCCNETLSASHQCEIPNISDVSPDSNIHKTVNNQICTPTSDHNHPPSAPPPHSFKHPNPEPPDGSTSTSSKTNELNFDNLLWAFNVVLDKRFSKPK